MNERKCAMCFEYRDADKFKRGYCEDCSKLYMKEYMRAYRLRDHEYYKNKFKEKETQYNRLVNIIQKYNSELGRLKNIDGKYNTNKYEKLKFAQTILGLILSEVEMEDRNNDC